MKSKGQNVIALICGILVIAILVALALFGVGDFEGVNRNSVSLGLDLVGGSRIVYQAQIPDGYDTSKQSEDLSRAVAMIQSRLNTLGYTEATVTTENNDRVVVEIPGINAADAIDKIGANGIITFELPDKTVILTSEKGDITNAKAVYNSEYGSYVISVDLANEDARTRFANGSKTAANNSTDNKIYIKQDGTTISSPGVGSEFKTSGITGDSFIITGNYTQDDANYYANLINSGSLPFTLGVASDDNVGATLGQNALSTSLFAGAIGILIVMILMILIYRLPGLVASVSLIGYTAMTGLCLVLFGVQLSLPGIAGIILSIGMAVDANVIIYERVKEELLAGKSTTGALKGGFKRAFTAILDSNITTLIAAVVLWFFGSGSVKGFAVTLLIGVLLSMIFAILVTRFFLARIVGVGVVNPWMYGVSKKKLAARTANAQKEGK